MTATSILRLFIAGSVLLFGYQRGENRSDATLTISLVMKTANNPFFIDMEKGAQEAADRLDVNLIVQVAEREVGIEK